MKPRSPRPSQSEIRNPKPAVRNMNPLSYFTPYQADWATDFSRLKLIEKSRQVGISYADAYHSVICATRRPRAHDVWISSRDELQSKRYLENCKYWARFLHLVAKDLGALIIDPISRASALVLQFANGKRIYALSSNPNALAGNHGHVKLDEFALHQDQDLLYQVAPPLNQWGGSLSIISTHRGAHTLFNKFINDIKYRGNRMGWSFHSVTIEQAVAQGLVERINAKEGAKESNEDFITRIRSQCASGEQWAQEYCCLPADESSAFLSYAMIESCEVPSLTLIPHTLENADFYSALSQSVSSLNLNHSPNLNPSPHAPTPPHLAAPKSDEGGSHAPPALYLGVDVARKHDLCVLDLGEKIGDVIWDRARIELRNQPFEEIKFQLGRLLSCPGLKRCCIDENGLGMQLAEEAKKQYGYIVEPITFTPQSKEDMAYKLRHAFEDRRLRIVRDDNLRADLRSIKKEVTSSGNIRFAGDAPDSHCDRFWAKALRQLAATSAPATWCPMPIVGNRQAAVAFRRARGDDREILA